MIRGVSGRERASATSRTPNAGELLEIAARRLEAVGGASARLEAQLLLGHALGRSRTQVLAHPEAGVGAADERAFQALVARREQGEPIAYLLGEREFYGRVFRVDRRALIPRPETELLVDLGLAAVARWRARGVEPTLVDVGTGCGAVAISVAAEGATSVVATDIAGGALALAQENAGLFGVSGQVCLVRTDLLAGVRGPLHVALANLPYVANARDLPHDVRDYEPAVAIFGGVRGTELIERLLHEARALLAPGAEVCVELDEEDQAVPVMALARELYPLAEVSVWKDGSGYDRVVRVVTSE